MTTFISGSTKKQSAVALAEVLARNASLNTKVCDALQRHLSGAVEVTYTTTPEASTGLYPRVPVVPVVPVQLPP